MTILEQIKAEIERLENYYTSVERHIEALISFLSALESEKQKEQKPVVTHGETYRVDTLGTQQVIAGKMPQKPELVQHHPITYTYPSNASRDERLKAALLALLNSDLLKVKEGGYFTKKDLIEWVERIPTDKEWSEEDEGGGGRRGYDQRILSL